MLTMTSRFYWNRNYRETIFPPLLTQNSNVTTQTEVANSINRENTVPEIINVSHMPGTGQVLGGSLNHLNNYATRFRNLSTDRANTQGDSAVYQIPTRSETPGTETNLINYLNNHLTAENRFYILDQIRNSVVPNRLLIMFIFTPFSHEVVDIFNNFLSTSNINVLSPIPILLIIFGIDLNTLNWINSVRSFLNYYTYAPTDLITRDPSVQIPLNNINNINNLINAFDSRISNVSLNAFNSSDVLIQASHSALNSNLTTIENDALTQIENNRNRGLFSFSFNNISNVIRRMSLAGGFFATTLFLTPQALPIIGQFAQRLILPMIITQTPGEVTIVTNQNTFGELIDNIFLLIKNYWLN